MSSQPELVPPAVQHLAVAALDAFARQQMPERESVVFGGFGQHDGQRSRPGTPYREQASPSFPGRVRQAAPAALFVHFQALRHRRGRRPRIFNTDQGSQFTSETFTGRLKAQGVDIGMDGRGRCMDNIFVERLRRRVKYEEVYLKDYRRYAEAQTRTGPVLSALLSPATAPGAGVSHPGGGLRMELRPKARAGLPRLGRRCGPWLVWFVLVGWRFLRN